MKPFLFHLINIILKYNQFLSTFFCIYVIQPGTSTGAGDTAVSAEPTPTQELPAPDLVHVRDHCPNIFLLGYLIFVFVFLVNETVSFSPN
jgi:hypothetical protein